MSAAVRTLILQKLGRGPKYARSFHAAKPVLDKLITEGLVERCYPEGGSARNMVQLSAKGESYVRQNFGPDEGKQP